jgi:hypothetical protein
MPYSHASLAILSKLNESLGTPMSNEISDDILELIQQEDDKQTKTFLLILYKLASGQTTLSNGQHETIQGLNRLSQEVNQQHSLLFNRMESLQSAAAARDSEQLGMKKVLVPLCSLVGACLLVLSGWWYTQQKEFTHRLDTLEQQVAVLNSQITPANLPTNFTRGK